MARDRSVFGIVSILTDFGTADGYVAAMKGVILGVNREARIVDVTHDIRPQDVMGGAFVLHSVCRYLPRGTVHLGVVDPGVGTDRAGVIVDTGESLFVGPDNGLLSFLLDEARGTEPRRHEDTKQLDVGRGLVLRRPARADSPLPLGEGQGEGKPQPLIPSPRSLPPGWRAVRIAEPRFWLPEPSNTFHGRDIFAPVAAHLTLGEPLESFGPPIERLMTLPVPRAMRWPDGTVRGVVLHVDRFGNLITSLRAPDLPAEPFQVESGAHRITGLARTYADGRGLVALMGSSGYLEIALPGGSAHDEIGVGVYGEVWARPVE